MVAARIKMFHVGNKQKPTPVMKARQEICGGEREGCASVIEMHDGRLV